MPTQETRASQTNYVNYSITSPCKVRQKTKQMSLKTQHKKQIKKIKEEIKQLEASIKASNEIFIQKTLDNEDIEQETRNLNLKKNEVQKEIENITLYVLAPNSEMNRDNQKLINKQKKYSEKLKKIKQETYSWNRKHEIMISQLIDLEQSIKKDIDKMATDYESAQKEMHAANLELHNLEHEEQKLIRIICHDEMHDEEEFFHLFNKKTRPKSDPVSILMKLKIQLESEISKLETETNDSRSKK